MTSKQHIRLFSRAQDGSAEAFSWIYSENFDAVYYCSFKATGSEGAAARIVRYSMEYVYEHLREAADYHAMLIMMHRKAYELCLSLDSDEAASSLSVSALLVNCGDNLLRILSGFETLSLRQRAVALLFYYLNLPEKQVAEVTGLALQEVREILYDHHPAPNSQAAPSLLTRAFDADADLLDLSGVRTRVWELLSDELSLNRPARDADASGLSALTARSSRYASKIVGLSLCLCALVMAVASTSRLAAVSNIVDDAVPLAQSQPAAPALTVEHYTIHIARGTPVTAELIVELSGARCAGGSGAPLPLHVVGLEEIDSLISGSYDIVVIVSAAGQSSSAELEVIVDP